MLEINNDGSRIAATNYWGSQADQANLYYCSVNAGVVRLLLPTGLDPAEMLRGCREVIISRGPWPARGQAEGVEILFEDGTDTPYALQLTGESFDMLPGDPGPGDNWRLAVWGPGPRLIAEFPARWRRVPKIPWLKPWGRKING